MLWKIKRQIILHFKKPIWFGYEFTFHTRGHFDQKNFFNLRIIIENLIKKLKDREKIESNKWYMAMITIMGIESQNRNPVHVSVFSLHTIVPFSVCFLFACVLDIFVSIFQPISCVFGILIVFSVHNSRI